MPATLRSRRGRPPQTTRSSTDHDRRRDDSPLGLAVLTPITLLYLVDLITGSFQGRRVRTYLLITALWTELVGVIGATALTVWFLNGRRNPDGWLSASFRLEFWWCKRHVTNLGAFTASRSDAGSIAARRWPQHLVARHSSHIDAIVPCSCSRRR